MKEQRRLNTIFEKTGALFFKALSNRCNEGSISEKKSRFAPVEGWICKNSRINASVKGKPMKKKRKLGLGTKQSHVGW